MRRLLVAVPMVAVMTVMAACGTSDGAARDAATTAASSATTSPSQGTSPTPSVDVTANTTAVCDKAGSVVTEETGTALGNQIGFMIVARQQRDAPGEAKAKAAIKTQADGWAQQLRGLKAQAADPALQAALETAALGLEKFGTDEYLASINSVDDASKVESDMTAAGTGLGKVCD